MPTLAERRRREAQEAALQGKIGADPLRNSFSHANGGGNSSGSTVKGTETHKYK